MKKSPIFEENETNTQQRDIIPLSKVELKGILAKENKVSKPGIMNCSISYLNCKCGYNLILNISKIITRFIMKYSNRH